MTDKIIRIKLDASGAKKSAVDLDRSIRDVGATADRTQFAVNKLSSAISTSINSAKQSVIGFLSVYSSIKATQAVIAIADEYAQLNGQLKLATNSSEELAIAQAEVLRIANTTRAGISDTAQTYATLERSTRSLHKSQSDILAVLETVNKAIQITSPSAESAKASLVQFGQALSGDFKNGSQELNSILEQTPGLADAIAKGLGVATGDLKKMGEQGKLSADLVFSSLEKVSRDVDEKFSKVPSTVSGALTQLRNDLVVTFGSSIQTKPLVDALGELRNTLTDPAVAEGLSNIAAALIRIAEFAAKSVASFAEFGNEIGYLSARAAGNVSELDILEKQLDDVNKTIERGRLSGDIKYLFSSPEDLKNERAQILEQIDVYNKAHGIKMQNEAEAKKASEDARAEAEKRGAADLERAKAELDAKNRAEELAKVEKKHQEEIKSITDSLKLQAATIDANIEQTTRYKLSLLGASQAQIEAAAAIAKTIDQIKIEKDLKESLKNRSDASLEIKAAQDQTASMVAELGIRTQAAQLYRNTELDESKTFFEKQRIEQQVNEAISVAELNKKFQEEDAKRLERYTKVIEDDKLLEDERAALAAEYQAQKQTADQLHETELTQIADEGAKARMDLAKAEFQGRIAMASSLADSLISLGQGHSKKVFNIGKAAAITTATINMFQGISEGIKLGYPAAIPAVALAAAQGLSTIQKIRSVNYSSGGGGGAPSAGGASSSSGGAGSSGGGGSQSSAGLEALPQQKKIYDLRGVKADDKISVAAFAALLESDGAIVTLESAREDAARRNVIGVTAR